MNTYQSALAALADPTRRTIYEALAARPHSVGELAKGLPVTRPAVSQHLRVLKNARLVFERRHGAKNIYCVDPRGMRALHDYFSQFWDAALQSLSDAALERNGS